MVKGQDPRTDRSDAAVLGPRVTYDSATGHDTMKKTITLLAKLVSLGKDTARPS